MKVMPFTTDALPRENRLAAFRQGATDYEVEAHGDPLDFSVSWRLLVLGELNLVDSRSSAIRYHRDRGAIVADGRDRVSVLCVVDGSSAGTIDDRAIAVGPGDAMIFDLTRPLDMTAKGSLRCLIATMPRYFLAEALPAPRLHGWLRASPELALAMDHMRRALDRAEEIPPESAAFYGRAIRDLVAVALMPAYEPLDLSDSDAPLLQRLNDALDQQLREPAHTATLAATLGVPAAVVVSVCARVGGLPALLERRRMLASYRLLRDPDDGRPIAVIAAACGYDDAAAFSRRFRQTFGSPPSAVRSQMAGLLPGWAGAYRVEDNYGPLLQQDDAAPDAAPIRSDS